jgi:hypothetical protein
MGNSKIYYFPTSTDVAGRQEIDFGETISDLQISPYRVVSDAVSIGGRFSRVARRAGMRVRIVHERFTDTVLAEKLYSLQSHLEAGGAISFAVDSDNVYASFIGADGVTFSGGTPVYFMEPQLFSSYGAGNPSTNDVLHAESFGANPRREEVQCQAYQEALNQLTLKTDLKYDHSPPVMVRHRDFFPALFWPQDQTQTPILSHDHRISYTLDLTLEVYPAHLRTMAGSASQDGPGLGGTLAEPGAVDLDSLVLGPIGTTLSSGSDEGPKSPAITGARLGGDSSDPLSDAIEMIEKLG